MTALNSSVQRRKTLFEIRNTLLRRRDTVHRMLLNRTDADHEEDLQKELRRIDATLEQMRRGTFGVCRKTGTLIPAADLLADPFLATVE